MIKNKLTKDEFLRSLEVAQEHLRSAEILLQAGQYRDSISRSYYAFFDLVAALLATKGLIPKTHGGALQLLGLHFIKSGILPEKIGKAMRRLLEERQKADYEWQTDFTKEEAGAALEEAGKFINIVKKLIPEIFD